MIKVPMHNYKIKLDSSLIKLINNTTQEQILSDNIWAIYGLTGEICLYEYKDNHYNLILSINETHKLFSMFLNFFYILSHVTIEEI